MTDTTWMKQRVPSNVILGCEDDTEPCRPFSEEKKDLWFGGDVLSDLAAAMTWDLCKGHPVTRRDLPKEAMVAVVRQLLA
jgi:hypothetical protein